MDDGLATFPFIQHVILDASGFLYDFFRTTDDNGASGPDHAGSQNSQGDTMAIVQSESSNVLPLKTCNPKKSNKKPSGKRNKRKLDREKNDAFNVRNA